MKLPLTSIRFFLVLELGVFRYSKIRRSHHHGWTQCFKTKKKSLSRLIYEWYRPIRYFLIAGLRERAQNCCLKLCVTGATKGTMRCQSVIGEFKNSRALPINVLFRFIMFVNYYIVNETQVLQWQAYSLARHKTWVRIPGLSHSQYYFFIINHVQR